MGWATDLVPVFNQYISKHIKETNNLYVYHKVVESWNFNSIFGGSWGLLLLLVISFFLILLMIKFWDLFFLLL